MSWTVGSGKIRGPKRVHGKSDRLNRIPVFCGTSKVETKLLWMQKLGDSARPHLDVTHLLES